MIGEPTKSILDILDYEGFLPGTVYGSYGAYWFNRKVEVGVESVRLYGGGGNPEACLYLTIGSAEPEEELKWREWWQLAEGLQERLCE